MLLAAVYVRACTSRPDQRRFKDQKDKVVEEARLRQAVLADLQNLQEAVTNRLVEVCYVWLPGSKPKFSGASAGVMAPQASVRIA